MAGEVCDLCGLAEHARLDVDEDENGEAPDSLLDFWRSDDGERRAHKQCIFWSELPLREEFRGEEILSDAQLVGEVFEDGRAHACEACGLPGASIRARLDEELGGGHWVHLPCAVHEPCRMGFELRAGRDRLVFYRPDWVPAHPVAGAGAGAGAGAEAEAGVEAAEASAAGGEGAGESMEVDKAPEGGGGGGRGGQAMDEDVPEDPEEDRQDAASESGSDTTIVSSNADDMELEFAPAEGTEGAEESSGRTAVEAEVSDVDFVDEAHPAASGGESAQADQGGGVGGRAGDVGEAVRDFAEVDEEEDGERRDEPGSGWGQAQHAEEEEEEEEEDEEPIASPSRGKGAAPSSGAGKAAGRAVSVDKDGEGGGVRAAGHGKESSSAPGKTSEAPRSKPVDKVQSAPTVHLLDCDPFLVPSTTAIKEAAGGYFELHELLEKQRLKKIAMGDEWKKSLHEAFPCVDSMCLPWRWLAHLNGDRPKLRHVAKKTEIKEGELLQFLVLFVNKDRLTIREVAERHMDEAHKTVRKSFSLERFLTLNRLFDSSLDASSVCGYLAVPVTHQEEPEQQCYVCMEYTEKDMVLCEGKEGKCLRGIHTSCISDEETRRHVFKLLNTDEDWFCDQCARDVDGKKQTQAEEQHKNKGTADGEGGASKKSDKPKKKESALANDIPTAKKKGEGAFSKGAEKRRDEEPAQSHQGKVHSGKGRDERGSEGAARTTPCSPRLSAVIDSIQDMKLPVKESLKLYLGGEDMCLETLVGFPSFKTLATVCLEGWEAKGGAQPLGTAYVLWKRAQQFFHQGQDQPAGAQHEESRHKASSSKDDDAAERRKEKRSAEEGKKKKRSSHDDDAGDKDRPKKKHKHDKERPSKQPEDVGSDDNRPISQRMQDGVQKKTITYVPPPPLTALRTNPGVRPTPFKGQPMNVVWQLVQQRGGWEACKTGGAWQKIAEHLNLTMAHHKGHLKKHYKNIFVSDDKDLAQPNVGGGEGDEEDQGRKPVKSEKWSKSKRVDRVGSDGSLPEIPKAVRRQDGASKGSDIPQAERRERRDSDQDVIVVGEGDSPAASPPTSGGNRPVGVPLKRSNLTSSSSSSASGLGQRPAAASSRTSNFSAVGGQISPRYPQDTHKATSPHGAPSLLGVLPPSLEQQQQQLKQQQQQQQQLKQQQHQQQQPSSTGSDRSRLTSGPAQPHSHHAPKPASASSHKPRASSSSDVARLQSSGVQRTPSAEDPRTNRPTVQLQLKRHRDHPSHDARPPLPTSSPRSPSSHRSPHAHSPQFDPPSRPPSSSSNRAPSPATHGEMRAPVSKRFPGMLVQTSGPGFGDSPAQSPSWGGVSPGPSPHTAQIERVQTPTERSPSLGASPAHHDAAESSVGPTSGHNAPSAPSAPGSAEKGGLRAGVGEAPVGRGAKPKTALTLLQMSAFLCKVHVHGVSGDCGKMLGVFESEMRSQMGGELHVDFREMFPLHHFMQKASSGELAFACVDAAEGCRGDALDRMAECLEAGSAVAMAHLPHEKMALLLLPWSHLTQSALNISPPPEAQPGKPEPSRLLVAILPIRDSPEEPPAHHPAHAHHIGPNGYQHDGYNHLNGFQHDGYGHHNGHQHHNGYAHAYHNGHAHHGHAGGAHVPPHHHAHAYGAPQDAYGHFAGAHPGHPQPHPPYQYQVAQ